MRRPCLLIISVLATLTLISASASAEFTPATLVSGNSEVPFEGAADPALSQDGRYVVFQGSIAGDSGIYRRDLQTGALEPVAAGSSSAINPVSASFSAPDAAGPSISADGRYVAFTSSAELDPEAHVPSEDRGCPQVYVRDMSIAPEAPGAYVLASVLSHTVTEGIDYVGGCPPGKPDGAQAASGVALSADGSRVVFTVLSPSNFTPEDEEGGGQVAVRDLGTHETILVSEASGGSGKAPVGGGAYPSSASEHALTQDSYFGEQSTASSASISGDGTTVAWEGTDVPQQVPSATDVTAHMAGLGGEAKEVEPLWRRIADGPSAVTKRLLGGSELNFYFTESHEETQSVEGGSLYSESLSYFVPPVLSFNGTRAVTIANAPTPANQASYAFAKGKPIPSTDAYTVAVNDDPATAPQITPLTATPSFDVERASLDAIVNVAMSPDGSRVGFDTRRTSFALSPPSLISPPAPETAYAYTYEANLELGTLQRVTSTFDGSPPNGEPGLLSFSEEGQTLAFASSASNLIFGTPTSGASEIYTTHELPSSSVVATQSISAAPPPPPAAPAWILSATAIVQRDGSVLIEAEVPAAGRLDALLSAQLARVLAKGRTSDPRGGRTAKRKDITRKAARKSSVSKLVATTVAQGSTITGGSAEVRLRVRVDAAHRSLVDTKDGLYCLLHLTFTAIGEPALSQVIPVTVRATSGATLATPQRGHRKPTRRSTRRRSRGKGG